jgi:hypothetical protein
MRTIGVTSFTRCQLKGNVYAMNAIHFKGHVPAVGRTDYFSRGRKDGYERIWPSDHRRLTAEEIRSAVTLLREALLADVEASIDGAGI